MSVANNVRSEFCCSAGMGSNVQLVSFRMGQLSFTSKTVIWERMGSSYFNLKPLPRKCRRYTNEVKRIEKHERKAHYDVHTPKIVLAKMGGMMRGSLGSKCNRVFMLRF